MKISDRNSRAASEYAEKKKQQLARANQLRMERDENSRSQAGIQSNISHNTSGVSSVSSEYSSDIVSRIVVKREPPPKQLNGERINSSKRILPAMPSLGEKLLRSEGKLNIIETTVNGSLQTSYSNRNFIVDGEDSALFSRSPRDPSGRCIDLCDRPIICGSTNGVNEVVIGSSDHALYAININDLKRKHITMYGKKYGHTDWVTGCCHLPDGYVVSCAMDGKICLWNRDRRNCVDLFGHQGSITKVIADTKYNTFFPVVMMVRYLGGTYPLLLPPHVHQPLYLVVMVLLS